MVASRPTLIRRVAALGNSRMIVWVEDHRTAERRSLAYHRAIAERIIRSNYGP